MTRVAQTYPQLVTQLARQEWSSDDLRLIRRAFDLAATLFVGAERGSGKPFIDHLVGTASGVVVGGGRPEDVAAALLHAAYDQGDFGDGRTGPRPTHRWTVRAAVGERVELLIHGYHVLGWTAEVAREAVGAIGALDDVSRSVLLIRIANELDDAVDGGLRVSGKQRLRVHDREVRDATARLAEALGGPSFGELVRRTLDGDDAASVPPELILDHVGSHRRLPLSARSRLWPALMDKIDSLRRSGARAKRHIGAAIDLGRRGSSR